MDDRRSSELAHSGRIRDACGREVRVISPLKMHLLRRHDVIEREALDAINEDITPGFRRNFRFAIIVLVITVVLTIGGIIVDYLLEGAAAWQDLYDTMGKMFPIWIPCLIGGVVVPWIAARQVRIKRTIAALLKHHRCLHCGYDLRESPVNEADGATICPECACAWRFDDENAADLEEAGGAHQRPVGIAVVVLIIIGLALLALLGAGLFLFRY